MPTRSWCRGSAPRAASRSPPNSPTPTAPQAAPSPPPFVRDNESGVPPPMTHQNCQLTRLAVLTAAAACCGGLAAAEPLGADGAADPFARSARTITVSERGTLQLVSKHGFTLNERGTASGTIRG